ncbi:MAG: TraR/DksA family transcriptional regulator [Gammaproteobacteria bacterium]
MNASERDAFRARLIALRDDIEQVAATGDDAAAIVTLDQTAVGRLSRMDAMQAQAMSLNAKQRRERTLNGIERALQRLRDDAFGDCMDCDEPIALARLRFDPTATLCIDCAAKRET